MESVMGSARESAVVGAAVVEVVVEDVAVASGSVGAIDGTADVAGLEVIGDR